MARYSGPVCRLCRREGMKLFLKGERCYTAKCAVDRRGTPPGEHGASRRKTSEYGVQLREKQKARRIYGVMEAQFRRYFSRAARTKGVTGTALLQTLERRLDNVVFRMGLADSRAEARQLVRHGHFEVNGRKTDIPSFLVREGDVVAVREKSRGVPVIQQAAEGATQRTAPAWLDVDYPNLRGKVLRLPMREEMDVPISEHLIIELYSR
ncbi:MAG: 30S ribosomal protein S4 [Firmicutes bacterium RBG_13_65_8]|nr:MAG: 30S ribosomal protein S4 [Firmicutes bacterium RBG_13_65_8]